MWLLVLKLRDEKRMESIGWITVFSGRQNRGAVVLGCRLFKIMVSLSRM